VMEVVADRVQFMGRGKPAATAEPDVVEEPAAGTDEVPF